MGTRCGCGGLQVSQRRRRDGTQLLGRPQGQAARDACPDGCRRAGPQAAEPGRRGLSPVLPGRPQRTRPMHQGQGTQWGASGVGVRRPAPSSRGFSCPHHCIRGNGRGANSGRLVSKPCHSQGASPQETLRGGSCGPLPAQEGGRARAQPLQGQMAPGETAPPAGRASVAANTARDSPAQEGDAKQRQHQVQGPLSPQPGPKHARPLANPSMRPFLSHGWWETLPTLRNHPSRTPGVQPQTGRRGHRRGEGPQQQGL